MLFSMWRAETRDVCIFVAVFFIAASSSVLVAQSAPSTRYTSSPITAEELDRQLGLSPRRTEIVKELPSEVVHALGELQQVHRECLDGTTLGTYQAKLLPVSTPWIDIWKRM